ncbi:hypothetical protein [Verrucosispora sp. FIM060022]|uniref:hypothetical protein n=1 Tax=Verrucosispora sp. FIM060022 TaxID=1479020 RepID=UPI000F88419A|nr:hypothetical protein [Verrucosispora sp. FIM060022]RUL89867.1 hypothetical protein EG812_28520 [Verrucosispora sp. FIM060022]
MTDEIHRQPLARAVLTALARTRGGDDPLGSLARTVLHGEADLRTAATHSWHGRALGDAFTASLHQRETIPADQRAEWERQAQRLRDAGAALTVEAAPPDGAAGDGREERR